MRSFEDFSAEVKLRSENMKKEKKTSLVEKFKAFNYDDSKKIKKFKNYNTTDENDNYAYHIAGDKDDEYSSGKADKLLAAITDDPDGVVDFLKQLTDGLYKSLDGKMKKTTLSSSSTVYNDVQMSNQLKTYEKDVKKWEEKITAYEDKWYNTFAQMEKSMSKMQSQQSQLAGMMGM